MRNKKRKRNKKRSVHQPTKSLIFPLLKEDIPAFEEALWKAIEEAIKGPAGKVNVRFVFPGRSQTEAQRLGSEFTSLLEQNLQEVRESYGFNLSGLR